MKEDGYRMIKCVNCGFKEYHDYVALVNLYGSISDPLGYSWNEGWKKPLKPWEPSPLNAGRSQSSPKGSSSPKRLCLNFL